MGKDAHPQLTTFRESIDNIDAALVCMLAERFRITTQVGLYKAEQNLPPADPSREGRQIQRLRSLAEQAHLDPDIAEKFLTFVTCEVVKRHEQIRNSTRSNAEER